MEDFFSDQAAFASSAHLELSRTLSVDVVVGGFLKVSDMQSLGNSPSAACKALNAELVLHAASFPHSSLYKFKSFFFERDLPFPVCSSARV